MSSVETCNKLKMNIFSKIMFSILIIALITTINNNKYD